MYLDRIDLLLATYRFLFEGHRLGSYYSLGSYSVPSHGAGSCTIFLSRYLYYMYLDRIDVLLATY